MKNLKWMLLAILSIALYSCEAEDGVNGIDGSAGIDGQDGEDGEGFELITQFGGITLNVSGTRADGKTIDAQPLEFIYSDFDADEIAEDNIIETGDAVTNFGLERKLDPEHAASLFIEFTLNNETSEVDNFFLDFDDVVVMSSDLVFFQIDGGFENFVSQSVTNFNFDEVTKAITFDFELVIDSGIVEVTSDLTLVGSVNALMPQQVETIVENP